MYGLKKDVNLSFLNGREVIQIAIGVYQTILRFDEDVTISVDGGFSHFDGQSESVWMPGLDAVQVAAQTATLLGSTVESFASHENGTLVLKFSNGHGLTIRDSSREYESYQISRPGETIVV
jgi:hypothetical protein